LEITKKDIEKLIELRKENTFLNHLWNIFSRDFRAKGEIKRNEIKVWKQNMWNSVFYPIFTFELNSKNHLINISDNLNPIGKTIIYLFFAGISYLILPNLIYEFDLIRNWILVLALSFFFLIFISVLRKGYIMEKRNQLEEIYEKLEIEQENTKPEKEWSLKNILIRIFTYPFSISIILICIWSVFKNGIWSVFPMLFGIGICGMYLYSDIKMILKNRKTTGNTVQN
jgi:hypothetical protein